MSIGTTVQLAASAFEASAFVVLAETPYQPLRAACGVDAKQRRRYQALFAAIEPSDELLIIEDTSDSTARRAHSWLGCLPDLRFIAGAPIRPDRTSVGGMLYVADEESPRAFSDEDAAMLGKLARLAADDLQLISPIASPSAAARLGAEHDFIEGALNALKEVFFVFTPDGTFLRWNDRVRAVTGYSDDEIAAMHPVDFFCPSDAARVEAAIEDVLREGESCIEVALRTKDGKRIPYAFTGSALTDRQGALMGICGVGRDITARTRAEEQLARSEARARRLARVAKRTTNAVIITDEHGAIEWVNEGFTRISGYTLEAVRGRQPGEVLQGPGSDPEVIAHMSAKIEQKEGFTSEICNYTQSGEPYWVRIDADPLFDEEGRMTGYMAIETDITEQKEVEAALRESQEQLQLALEAATMGIWDWDMQHDELLTSASARRIFGVERGHPITPPGDFMACVHPDDTPQVRTAIREAITGKGRFNEEYRIERPDGSTRWVNMRGRVHADAQGTPMRMIGTVLDITERKAADAALRESEALNRAMLQAIPDLIFRFSSDGTYLNVEADQQGKLVQPVEVLLGRSVADVLPSDVARQWMTMIEDALATGTVQQGEYPLVTQEGEERIFEARVAPLNGDEVEAIVRDITERKRQQQRLVEAKERAEEMSRLKSAFLANMSHELRTPLTAILGFAEILTEEVAAPNREFVHLIAQSGRRLMETLNSVLDLAQLESRTVTLENVCMDLRARAKEALSMFELRASDGNIRLSADVPDTPVWAVIDPSAMDRILSNLISNALKFTTEGEVRVSVQEADGHAKVQVEDTGIGIDAAFLPHIFDEFRQESTGSSREFEGVGLGLTITRRLIRQMGGEIDVESTKGEGTVFTVRLPTADPNAADPGSSAAH